VVTSQGVVEAGLSEVSIKLCNVKGESIKHDIRSGNFRLLQHLHADNEVVGFKLSGIHISCRSL
jgi:hypothetical protein